MYQRKDPYYRRAKAGGLRSRAAFKLDDLDRGLIRGGDRVLDLGAWPGGWLQVAARHAGHAGVVVGIDLQRIDPLPLPNVRLVQGDVASQATIDAALRALGGPANVVLSDLSPKLTGIRDRDDAQATQLARLALTVAARTLAKGGAFVCKVFMNADHRAILGEFRRRFERVTTTRSEATRKGSAELYVVARGFRG